MDFERLLRVFRKWFWLVILAAAIGAGITAISSINRTFTYQAQARVLIGGFIGSMNPNRGEIETAAVLAETYVELARTPLILQGVIDELGLEMTAADLKELIVVGKPSNPPIIVIQGFANDPDTALAITNATARHLIANSPSNLTPAQQAQIDLAREQIVLLNRQVQDALAEVTAIDERLSADPDAQMQVNPLTQQRTELINQINQATANIAQFQATINSLEQQTHRLEIIEPAFQAQFFRTGPGLLESIIISGITGAVLAIIAILLIDYMDTSLKSSKDVTRALDVPVVGTIPQLGKRRAPYERRLITNWPERSALAEAYRALQTNLLAGGKRQQGVYIITSPGEHEGKSVTAANLAVTMALNGLRVLLVDADLVQPRIHEIFELENELGLKNLIAMSPTAITPDDLEQPTIKLAPEAQQTLNNLNACVQQTPIENLRIITSGPVSQDSTHLSEYNSLRGWVAVFEAVLDVDVILFDTPPCLLVSDASILASTIEAGCVLVVQSGRTGRDAAIQAQTQFRHIGRDFVGVVLNRVKHYDMDHGYNSGYFKNQADMRDVLAGQPVVSVIPDRRILMNGSNEKDVAEKREK